MLDIIFCLIVSSAVFSDTKYCQEETVTGVISFTYVKDTLGYERYWLQKKSFNGLYFEDAIDVLPILSLVCKWSCPAISKDAIRIYDLPEYQSQSEDKEDFYTHTGGDIYLNKKGEIVIAFQMTAKVVKYKLPPCGILFQSSYWCPVEKEEVKYPVYLIINVISAGSLENSYLKEKGLLPFESKSFPVGKCD